MLRLIATALFMCLGFCAPVLAGHVYLTDFDSGLIRRCTLSGASMTTLRSGVNHPVGIAYDSANDRVFYTDGAHLKRIAADGSGSVTTVATNVAAYAIDVNPSGNHVYCAVTFGNAIVRVNVSNGAVTTLFSGGGPPFGGPDDVDAPGGIAVDTVNDYVYWTEDGAVKRGAIDGSGDVETLVTTGLTGGIALDIAGGKMYWGVAPDSGQFMGTGIYRANLDGSNVTLVQGTTNIALDVALDVGQGKVYWCQDDEDAIRKAPITGGTTTVVASTDGLVTAIDVEPN